MHPKITVTNPKKRIKRREGETITIRATVEHDAPPKDLIVEVWGAIHDELGEQPAAYTLNYQHTLNNTHHYEATYQLPHTGHFPLKTRARHKDQTYWSWAERGGEKTVVDLWVDPAYVYDSIVYNAFVRYFGAKQVDEDGEIREIEPGTFKDLGEHIENLKHIGVNILYLNPIHMIGELYKNYNPHDILPEYLQPGCPYSVKDYKSVDPELSFGAEYDDDEEHPFHEFKKLVDIAHSHGIRVYMDLVFNHSAHDSVFQRIHPEWFLYKQNPWSLEDEYIYPDEMRDGKPWGDPKHTFSPYDHQHWWRDTAQLNWNNLHDLPTDIFPHHKARNEPPENPTIHAMYRYFKNIVKFWIKEFGIDGFRCDVAYRIPMDFWEECITEARKTAKNAYPQNGSVDGDVVFIAEDYHVDMNNLLDAGFTACYGDYSNKLGSLPDITGYLDYMYNISGEHFPEGTTWFTFPECHDFHRNPTKIAKQFREEHRDADLNANKSRWTMTATLPGIPMIFNGFEKLEWEPASLFSYSKIDWESDKDITEHIKKVNLVRKHEKALQRGSYHYLHTDQGINHDAQIFSYARIHNNEVIIIAVNIDVVNHAETTVHIPENIPKPATFKATDLLTNEEHTVENGSIHVSLLPGEAIILKPTTKS